LRAPKSSIKTLDIREDAFPIRFGHPHHIVHLQQRINIQEFFGLLKGELEVVPPVGLVQVVPVHGGGVAAVHQSAERQAVVPARGEIRHRDWVIF